MLSSILSFCAGIIVIQQFSSLPGNFWIIILSILLSGLAFFRYWKAIFFVIGLLWAIVFASFRLDDRLSESIQGQHIEVEGKVAGLPQTDDRRVRFDLVVTKSNVPVPEKVRLSWFFPKQEIKAGQDWRFSVKLKTPHGRFNADGFDYERWLFINNIGATGYVKNKPQPINISTAPWWQSIATIRQAIADKLNLLLEHSHTKGIIKALTIGERNDLKQQQWDIFKKTGTVHLLAISGLHIGLISGLVYFLVFNISIGFSAVSPQKIAVIAAIVAALFYSALAGFSLPTQRSLLMLSIVMASISWQRNILSTNILALALFGVLIFDPSAVLSAGFWLSFFAVVVIVYSLSGRLAAPGYWLSAFKIHWVTALGLLPLLVYFFQQVSIVSPVANFFTVPIISLLVVPLCLLAVISLCFSLTIADKLFYLIDQILLNLEAILSVLAKLPYAAVMTSSPPVYAIPLAVVGIFLLLSPKGIPARWLGIVMLIPLFWKQNDRIFSSGELNVTLMDVGQGLSAIIETSQHVLVFDTGAKYSSQYDMGEAVVIPFLKNKGILSIDKLLISHGDNDHMGGAESVIKQSEVKEILTSVPNFLEQYSPVQCKAGQKWNWDQVEFEILSPVEGLLSGDNNNSCVLKISTKHGNILFTGDIEEEAENWLVENVAIELESDILIAPHHGSNTSSTMAFLKKVNPKHVLIPSGYENRFSFPHQEVLERYKKINSQWMNTADMGALTVHLKNEGLSIKSERVEKGKYWNN